MLLGKKFCTLKSNSTEGESQNEFFFRTQVCFSEHQLVVGLVRLQWESGLAFGIITPLFYLLKGPLNRAGFFVFSSSLN